MSVATNDLLTVTEQDIDEIMYQDSITASTCRSSEFDCGTKCIDSNLVCDGKHDCPEGQDEYNDHCIIDQKNAFCPYPNLPSDRYTVKINYTSKDKGIVPELVQGLFKCNKGYFSNTVNEIVSTCIQRAWEPPIISCRKICPQINNTKLEQKCYRQSMVDCNDIIWERTVVKFTCQESYLEPTFDKALCLPNGKWTLDPNKIECRPIRGHITGETAAALGHKDFPWRVLIREQGVNQSQTYFSGTLIDKKMILTDGNLLDRSKLASDFVIFVNDEIESWGPRKSYEIRTIHFLPPQYHKFLSPDGLGNLAILEPYEEVEYSLTVMPAGILPFSYPASLKIFNNTGMMAILNDSEDLQLHDTFIIILKTFEGICKINREKCNQYYGQLLKTDNGALLSELNLGSGLIKAHPELKLYFVEGVYNKRHLKSDDLLIFTFVSDYIEWIDEIREKTKYNKTTLTKKIPEMVEQFESTSHSTYYINKLTLLILLPFVIILIAVRFRITDRRFLKITCCC